MVQNGFSLKLYGRNKTSIVGNCYYDLSEKIYFGGKASVSGVYIGIISFLIDHSYFYVPAFHKVWLNTELQLTGAKKRKQKDKYTTYRGPVSMNDGLSGNLQEPATVSF